MSGARSSWQSAGRWSSSRGSSLPRGRASSASTLMTTGPGGGATASATAWRAACSALAAPTVTAALATDRPSAGWSSRWWLILSRCRAGTVSAMTTTGSRSSAAWAMPLTALASPGPRVTTTAPAAPVRSAQVAAMIVAAVSPWARTNGSPLAAAAPTTSRFGPPPGIPNSSRVPAAHSASTMAAAVRCDGDMSWLVRSRPVRSRPGISRAEPRIRSPVTARQGPGGSCPPVPAAGAGRSSGPD